eukprot:scaffold5995_cov71-Cyclotella_meneghiniana.AAC.6
MIAIDAWWSELGVVDAFGFRRERWTDGLVGTRTLHTAHGTLHTAHGTGGLRDEYLEAMTAQDRPATGIRKTNHCLYNREGRDIRWCYWGVSHRSVMVVLCICVGRLAELLLGDNRRQFPGTSLQRNTHVEPCRNHTTSKLCDSKKIHCVYIVDKIKVIKGREQFHVIDRAVKGCEYTVHLTSSVHPLIGQACK